MPGPQQSVGWVTVAWLAGMTEDPKLEIDWVKTFAGALAAVSTAVLLSTLGAVGTLIGAALGSVAVTVSSQLYAQGLARSKRSLAKAQESALFKVGVAQAEVRRAGRRQGEDAAEAHLEVADERLGEAKADLDEVVVPAPTWRERLAVLPWKKIAALTVATFVVVLVVIASFEALTGRSVSSFTGGSEKGSSSTFNGGGSSSDDGEDDKDGEKNPDRQPSEGTEPTEQPSDGAPSEPAEPTETAPTEPTEVPTTEPTEPVDPTPTEPLPAEDVPTVPAPAPTP